ncbi:MAG: CvpA family protein [Flavobacteriaceae bacterium]|nr:CvpA family protein [Flavobacteriaceae bacterium]
MNYIDIALAIILVYGLVKGFMKGFVIEITSLLSLLLGVYGAIHFSYFIGDWLKTKVSWEGNTIQVASFTLTFLVLLFAVSMVGKLVTKLINVIALGLLNKIAGSIFGVVKIALIVSVLINMFAKLNDTIAFINKDTLEKSFLYSPVKTFAPTIFPSIMDTVEKLKDKIPDENKIIINR